MVDLLFLTHNRREFTEFTFQRLLENTNWELVDRLIVYDDSSTDGAREEVVARLADVPVPSEIRDHGFGSPVAVMNHYIRSSEADLFAKVDNDLAVSPGWLEALLGVMERNPDLELLGMEPSFMMPPPADWDGVYTYTPWRHIGGNGLMRVDAFRRRAPMDVDGYHGFSGWQWRHEPVLGFITPDLPACLLDRAPTEPWVSLSREYVAKKWQRPWGKISESYPYYFDWLDEKVTV